MITHDRDEEAPEDVIDGCTPCRECGGAIAPMCGDLCWWCDNRTVCKACGREVPAIDDDGWCPACVGSCEDGGPLPMERTWEPGDSASLAVWAL